MEYRVKGSNTEPERGNIQRDNGWKYSILDEKHTSDSSITAWLLERNNIKAKRTR